MGRHVRYCYKVISMRLLLTLSNSLSLNLSISMALTLSINLALTPGSALADEYTPPITVTSMTNEYTKGNYQMAKYIGAQLLKQEPSNLAIHYLLGNCYVKFNQLDKAAAEYKFCAQLGQGSQIGTFAKTALDQISGPSIAPAAIQCAFCRRSDNRPSADNTYHSRT